MNAPATDTFADRSGRGPGTLATRLEHRLACEILRGDRGPGSQLPSVRALAAELGTTPPTIQRVIERLAAIGLVEVRRGSGVRVLDPLASGDLALVPLWFEALRDDDPGRLVDILADFLELRRIVASRLVASRSDRLAAAAPELATSLEPLLGRELSLAELVDVDLAFTRAVLAATGQFAALSIYGTIERLVREAPSVAESLYADRAHHRETVTGVVAALAGTDRAPAEVASEVETLLASWDARTVERFRGHVVPPAP